jgi:hypothetical protein
MKKGGSDVGVNFVLTYGFEKSPSRLFQNDEFC